MSDNKHGLDHDYFRKKLKLVVRDSERYTPAEMHTELTRLAAVAQQQPNDTPISPKDAKKLIGTLRFEHNDEQQPTDSAKLKKLAVFFYNCGYNSGHNDTIESCFTPVLEVDQFTYHDDVVEEIYAENRDEIATAMGVNDE